MLFFVPFFIGACNPRIVDFTNTKSDFKAYATFAVINLKANQASISPEGKEILSIIEQSISGQMMRRGYEEERTNQDLIVRYEIISNQSTQVSQGNYSPYIPSYNFTTVRNVLESALLIEITDTRTKKLVWQASVDMEHYTKKRKQEEIIEQAITNLFDTYLYRAKSNVQDPSLIVDK